MAVNFLLKRSTTASKRPTAAQLDIGELSLNYDANTAGVFFEDSTGNVRKVGPVEVSATAPNDTPAGSSGNSLGELWFDTSVNNLKVWTGASFVGTTTSVATLTTTRTLWGQNFDGSANVTGSLSSVTDISASGTITGGTFVPSSSTVPTNGLYLSAANTIALATNNVQRLSIDSNGRFVYSTNTGLGGGGFIIRSGTGPTDSALQIYTNGSVSGNNVSSSYGDLSGSLPLAILAFSHRLTDGSTNFFNASPSSVSVQSYSATPISITSGSSGAITLDSGTVGAVNIGNGGSAKTITLGNTIGATTVNVNSGTGGVLVSSPHLTIANQGEIRFREASLGGTNYIALEAPPALASDVTFLLPGSDGSATTGYSLKSNGSAALSFGTANIVTSDTAPSNPLDGDLWYSSSSGRLFVYYQDTNTSQWVDAAPPLPPLPIPGGSSTEVQYNNAGVLAGTSLLTVTTSVNVAADILPTSDNVRNLGSASFRFANVYTGDLHLKNDRGDWTIIEEEDCLTMRNNKTGKVYDIMMKERNA